MSTFGSVPLRSATFFTGVDEVANELSLFPYFLRIPRLAAAMSTW